MTVTRKRYIAMKDNRTKVLMDIKGLGTYGMTYAEWVEKHWYPFEDLKDARILSWSTPNKAKAALRQGSFVQETNFEIVEIVETITF